MDEREPTPNIYGIETEYSCMVTLPGGVVHELVGSCHSRDEQLGLYISPDYTGAKYIDGEAVEMALNDIGLCVEASSGMLSNGGRLYFDESGPEYATPETTTAEEAVHRSFDGDEIVLKFFEKLRRSGAVDSYQINRRIVDHNRSSRGVHLNTLTELPNGLPIDTIKRIILNLAALNVAKGAIFGSGGLLINGAGRTEYHHSPRLSITSGAAQNAKLYQKRPLVRLPFKTDVQCSRIETITSDALNFAWPLRASMVLTNSLVRMLECGEQDLPVLLSAPLAAEIVGKNGNANMIPQFRDGKCIAVKPAEVLRQICEAALEMDTNFEILDDESYQVILEILDVLDGLEQDPLSVASQVESIYREIAIEEKMQRDKLTIDSERICRFDYYWDMLDGGVAERLRKRNAASWLGFTSCYAELETRGRLLVPPQDTRAKVRGEFIKTHNGRGTVNWHSISLSENKENEEERTYLHPLTTET